MNALLKQTSLAFSTLVFALVMGELLLPGFSLPYIHLFSFAIMGIILLWLFQANISSYERSHRSSYRSWLFLAIFCSMIAFLSFSGIGRWRHVLTFVTFTIIMMLKKL